MTDKTIIWTKTRPRSRGRQGRPCRARTYSGRLSPFVQCRVRPTPFCHKRMVIRQVEICKGSILTPLAWVVTPTVGVTTPNVRVITPTVGVETPTVGVRTQAERVSTQGRWVSTPTVGVTTQAARVETHRRSPSRPREGGLEPGTFPANFNEARNKVV